MIVIHSLAGGINRKRATFGRNRQRAFRLEKCMLLARGRVMLRDNILCLGDGFVDIAALHHGLRKQVAFGVQAWRTFGHCRCRR